MVTLSLNIPLPADFQRKDFLEFHSRDAMQVSERLTATSLEKGILWSENPACIRFLFEPQQVLVELAVDNHGNLPTENELLIKASHMLGLTQSTPAFEATFQTHPDIGALLAKQRGLRVPQSASLFEALSWAVTGQQISLGAAIAIRRKLILHAGIRHSSGIHCYPDAAQIAAISATEFRALGFSKTKAETLTTVSRMVLQGSLPLPQWANCQPIDEITQQLLNIKGIGRWTVNYTLLRGLAWLDGSLHGDAAVRSKLSALLSSHTVLSEKEASLWLEQFSPWRALVAAHLWAMEKKLSQLTLYLQD